MSMPLGGSAFAETLNSLPEKAIIMRFIIIALISLLPAVAGAQVGNNQQLANPNLTDKKTLATLPHVSSAIAEAIVSGRPYLKTSDLDAVLEPLLNEKQRTELYGRLFRPLNLNTASEAEIKLIPGMSRKMVHEFEEYRPYTSLKQFRREIGKYVDSDEVARLEQYVFVPMNLNTAAEEDFKTIPGMSRKMLHEFDEYKPYKNIEQFRREIGKYVDADEVARLESYLTVE